ncbi:UDP-N-acetylmuramoyl-L-alanyl-D-glutamate--2,6-diaminopimelate ligase [Pseudoramibacter porci]|nr:UDP-N-acetylmuramoyl-L-alanyl-D-glutamate--2,6-diaminopimelate ligase [Pseudoramibacter porci]
MNYHDLLTDEDIIEIKNGELTADISDVVYDSRQVRKNALFVAIFGFAADGHQYIESAIEKGAAVIVHQADLAQYHDDVTYIKVTDTRKMLGIIASRFFDHPSSKLTISAITGTNGKTSSTYFLTRILTEAGKTCARMGTINDEIDGEIFDNKGRTTSESRDTQAFIAKAVDYGCTDLVMEASSQALDLDRLVNVDFDYALFTNLTQDHLDYHKTFENYFLAKAKLFDQTSQAAIINTDDEWGVKLVDRIHHRHRDLKVITYGTSDDADYKIESIDCTTKGSQFTLRHGDEEEGVFLDVLGRFMVFNAVGTIIAAREQGVGWEIIKKALADAPVVDGRMDRVPLDLDFDVIVDYAHTPDALDNILSTVRELTDGKIIAVFGCGGDRDHGKRPKMGKISAEKADFTVLTSDNSRTEDPDKIIDDIEAAVKPITDQYIRVTDRREATAAALKMAKKGDVVIFAGKGHEKTETSRNGVRPYYEKEVIQEVAKELGL